MSDRSSGRGRWVVGAGAVGALAVWKRKLILPKRPRTAPYPIPRRIPDPEERPAPDGTGVRIVVNPSSGPAWSDPPTEELRAGLPGADIHELAEDDDLDDLLSHDELIAVGAAGGDGTLAAVAKIASDREVPFVAVPAGTLNHLARDLGLKTVDDTVDAVRAGTFCKMDLGIVDDRCFVNTLTFGGYAQVVDERERLEGRIGKWPALLVALFRELPRMEPLCVEIDGEERRVWLAWIGNCLYEPAGFAPAWRESLDDGMLDVRIVNGVRKYSRTRFAFDVLFGRLKHCPVYEERHVPQLSIRSLDGPLRLAADGETFDGPEALVVTKKRQALRVAVPPDPDRSSARPSTTSSVASTSTPAPVIQGPASS
jgi:diacylglycerol kinase family enzyme